MCQLCQITDLTKRDRWPNELEQHKSDIELVVTCAHDGYKEYKQATSDSTKPSPPEALLGNLRTLAALLDEVESDRQKWWSKPQKRDQRQRQRLQEEGNQQKLSALHKVNNDVNERLEAMNAKLGQFVKWRLGMNGGVWELRNGGKVDVGESKR